MQTEEHNQAIFDLLKGLVDAFYHNTESRKAFVIWAGEKVFNEYKRNLTPVTLWVNTPQPTPEYQDLAFKNGVVRYDESATSPFSLYIRWDNE